MNIGRHAQRIFPWTLGEKSGAPILTSMRKRGTSYAAIQMASLIDATTVAITTSLFTNSTPANRAMAITERHTLENPPISRRSSFWNAPNQYWATASNRRNAQSA